MRMHAHRIIKITGLLNAGEELLPVIPYEPEDKPTGLLMAVDILEISYLFAEPDALMLYTARARGLLVWRDEKGGLLYRGGGVHWTDLDTSEIPEQLSGLVVEIAKRARSEQESLKGGK